MKVLITGGLGYMGSVASNLLLRRGHEVWALDNLSHGGQPLLSLNLDDHFHFLHWDIRSADLPEGLPKELGAVVNLAAIVGDPACAREPALAREINLDGALRLFRLAEEWGAERFVFASTCSNYGKMADPSKLATEETELNPISLYAETKVAVERALLDSESSSSPAATVLRFATLFGLSPRMRFDLTVNEFTMQLLTERKLKVFGEQFWRPYVHVRDAAQAIAQVLEATVDQVGGQIMNVGDDSLNYQKGQLVELICEEIGGQLDVERVHRDEDPRDYRVSFNKIHQKLGFQTSLTVKDGIQEIIRAINAGVIADVDSSRYRN